MTATIRPSTTAHTFVPVADRFAPLRAQVTGEVITPEAAEFDTARQVAFFTVDRRPLAIVRAATVHDVAAAVSFARDGGYPLAVRSGGHSVAHQSMIDDAVVVDLSAMKRISIFPEARIARVQAGVNSGELSAAAQEYGLALSTGDTSSVGLGGLATGGGIGFLARKHGLTIDSLLAAQVVTAAGEIVTASPDEHADLFWAIRGGGGNFGIVTEFVFRLARVGEVLGGVLVLPASRAVLRGYLDCAAAAPDELTTIANLMHLPPLPFVPQERVGEMVSVILACWTGDMAEGQAALAPLRALAAPVADLIGPMPYAAMYRFTDEQTAKHGVSVRSMFAGALSDETLDATLSAMERATSPFSAIQFRALGGAVSRVAGEATAFAHRDASYFLTLLGVWMDPTEAGTPHQAWVEGLWQAIRGDATGAYVNFLENEGEARLREAYPAATYARLAQVKAQYDPQNLFRFNQNIAPQR